MKVAEKFLLEISEVSQRKKEQLEDQLKDFQKKLKTASGDKKKTLEKAIEGTKLAIDGKSISSELQQQIFKALEL